jgi:hypothetical protein
MCLHRPLLHSLLLPVALDSIIDENLLRDGLNGSYISRKKVVCQEKLTEKAATRYGRILSSVRALGRNKKVGKRGGRKKGTLVLKRFKCKCGHRCHPNTGDALNYFGPIPLIQGLEYLTDKSTHYFLPNIDLCADSMFSKKSSQ